jgi:hypothetical protein
VSVDKVANLVALVGLLRTEPDLSWDAAKSLLRGFPNWRRVVEMLQMQPSGYTDPYNPRPPTVPTDPFLPALIRKRLLEELLPFALLLDPQYSTAERIALLEREAGVETVPFCESCLQAESPEIVAAAQALLQTCESQETLLRGSAHASTEPGELLRTSTADSVLSDALLTPSAPPPAPTEPFAVPWFRRLFPRRK